MRAFVVVATKGRANETSVLLDYLERQNTPPELTVIVGTEAEDVEGLSDHSLTMRGEVKILLSPCQGSSIQRNYGLEYLQDLGYLRSNNRPYFCAFFDDDVRLAPDWLQNVGNRFAKGDIVGLTGQTLGDGVGRGGLSEDYARDLLAGAVSPEPHWASGPAEREVGSVYGCNMAFRDVVVEDIRFDEKLPLYGWQEDRDYTGQAKRRGRVIYFPGAHAVHLAAHSGGRTSGVRYGYSQIMNPVYLMLKGTMTPKMGFKFISRTLAANALRSFRTDKHIDYRGRLRGTLYAIGDLCLLRCDPRRVTKL